jgi:hypothetical protein
METTNPRLILFSDHGQEDDKDRQMLLLANGFPRCKPATAITTSSSNRAASASLFSESIA